MDFHVAVPGPFTYLVHEHARSIIAIQELQQEVTSLLEFRDHVLEALPHLHHYHSLAPAPSHDPPPAPRPAPPPTTRAEASPSKTCEGTRQQQQRAISSTGGGGGGNSSSSSTGGKSLSETHSSSAVADSGFSTDKAGGSMGKSSSSSAGEHLSGAEDPRWTSVEPEVPLGSAEDELWQLLDVIQRKGTRLRHELERAERAERARLSSGTPPHHHHHHTAPASDPLTSPRHPQPPAARDYWPHSLPGPTPADLLPPPPPPPLGVALEAEAWAAVERLRQDRQYLVGRVGWAEAEAAASHQRLVDLHGQLMALAGDKRRLEDQVRALRLDTRPEATSRGVGGGAGVNTVTIMTDHVSTAAAATNTTTTISRPRRPTPAVTVSVAGQDPSDDALRGRGLRSASSVRLNTDRDVVLPRVLKVPIKDRTARPAPAPAQPQEEEGASGGVRRGSDRVVIERERRAGRADGGFSMPVSLLKGARLRVAPDKQRISAILREKDVLELQRQLLTTVMETEVLKKQIESASEEWTTKTSEWETDHRLALATITNLKEENTRLKQQLEEGAAPVVEQREVGVTASPVVVNTSTMTGGGGGGAGQVEEATHTVHAGPNVKYDVVVHQECGAGRRSGATVVEKPPRRSREPRSAPSPAPPQREAAESPGGRDSLGRGSGSRPRVGLSHSGRGTPTSTPRSSPAPSITPRMCTTRASPQEPPRATPLSRSSSGAGVRSTLGRRDSLKAAQAKAAATGGGKSGGGGAAAAAAAGQHKVAPARSAHQGGVCQPRPVREMPRSPLTLADLRTPSPSPASAPLTRPTATRKVGVRSVAGRRLLHHREAAGVGTGHTPSPGAPRLVSHGSRGVASPHQELRLSHLTPASSSPSPPASCSSYYDSINSEGRPGLAPDKVMHVEVAFEWSPVSPPSGDPRRHLHPDTHVWPPWPHSPDTPRPWPPDSLEGAGVGVGAGFEEVGRMRSQLVAMNGAARGSEAARSTPGAVAPGRGRSPGRLLPHPQECPGGCDGAPARAPAPHADQDLNTRVHQILSRIASGGQ